MTLPAEAAYFLTLRERMVESQLRARGIRDQRVLDAMLLIPRHEFVPERFRDQAYDDHPLPIGYEQTISQPYIVAIMLEALELRPSDRALEVGTGSGYQTALLAQLADRVYSVERYPSLADEARRVLEHLDCTNASVITGDGTLGLPEFAPFDAIIVSAAASELPTALLAQLAEGGRMIIPVGGADYQELQLVRMIAGEPVVSVREACRFVPLIAGPPEEAEE